MLKFWCTGHWSLPASLFCGYRRGSRNELRFPGSSLTCSHKTSNVPHSPSGVAGCPQSLQRISAICVMSLHRIGHMPTPPPLSPEDRDNADETSVSPCLSQNISFSFHVEGLLLRVQMLVPRPVWGRSTRWFVPLPISSSGPLPTKPPLILYQSPKCSFKWTSSQPAHQFFKKG